MGIHFSPAMHSEDLQYNFSKFSRRNTNTVSTQIEKSRFMNILKNVPLVGKDACSEGVDKYLRAKGFDAKHLDTFIKSRTNFVMS